MSTIDPRWDLAVIGGDRVGHDVAHEAASRGARVVLVMPGAGNADPVGNDQVRVLTGMPRLVGAGELEIVSSRESYAVMQRRLRLGRRR